MVQLACGTDEPTAVAALPGESTLLRRAATRSQPRAECPARHHRLTDAEFTRIYATHHGEVRDYFRKRVRNAMDIEDLTARTFLCLWSDWVPDEPWRRELWVRAVARRILSNQWRALERQRNLFGKLARFCRDESASAAPEVESLDPAVLVRLRVALGHLSEGQYQAVVLVGLMELSREEAALLCGCLPNAFDQRLFRARQALRAELGAFLAL